MSDDLRIGKFDRVRIDSDGPDVWIELPKNPARAHWSDFQQIVEGLQVKINEAMAWEVEQRERKPGH